MADVCIGSVSINDDTLASKLEMIKLEKAGAKKNVGLITLNRPKALNSLCAQLMTEVSCFIIFWKFPEFCNYDFSYPMH